VQPEAFGCEWPAENVEGLRAAFAYWQLGHGLGESSPIFTRDSSKT